MTARKEDAAICIRPRRKHVCIPVAAIESDLPDDAVRALLHICVLEDVEGRTWTVADVAERMHLPGDRAELLVRSLLAAELLTTDPPAEQPEPESRPVEQPRYLGHRWFGSREQMESRTAAIPGPGEPVVYVLFDADDRCAYVGATDGFSARFQGHRDKPWVRFEARLCNSRAAADDLELVEIRELKPYLNRAPGSLAAMKRAGLL